MNIEILKYLSNKIREEQEIISEDTVLGKAKDHGEYKYACGIYRGLSLVNAMIIEMAERMEKDDE
jgi:ribosomal protein S4E